jgi:hypothetical protein
MNPIGREPRSDDLASNRVQQNRPKADVDSQTSN